MKILHITTQKPNSTGSGVYMCGMINGFREKGHKQGVVAGVDKDDINSFNDDIEYYPVFFNSDKLPFDVVGMSDSMPYNSTIYSEMDLNMVNSLKGAFEKNIKKAVSELKPDLIICHHLYLLTSFVREIINDINLVSICHGTCLRQIQSHDLEKNYIISNIRKLDAVFALHDEQRKEIIKIFNIDPSKVFILGSGYDNQVFFKEERNLSNEKITITYAGKICKAKGVKCLIKSLNNLKYERNFININVVGDGSNKEEYEEIIAVSKDIKFNINFLGKINQIKLSKLFRESHIFVLPSFFEGLPLVVIESLASGCNVITTDIPGLRGWIGENINNSEKVSYIDLPKMQKLGIPVEKELKKFEDNLSASLNYMIENILNKNTRNKMIDMENKTWSGLCSRLENIIQ